MLGSAGEAVVFGEIARRCAPLPKGVGDAVHGLLGDVFVERSRARAGCKDALDGACVEGAKARGVAERGVDVGGREALSQEQDLTCLVSPVSRRSRAHQAKEARGMLAHVFEGDAKHVEVDRCLSLRSWVESGGIEPESLAARGELVACNAGQVGGVDEELLLGDADGEEIGDVVVGDGVGIPFPSDEAIDGADAVNDARRVVRMARQRHEVLALLVEALEGCLSITTTLVDNGVEPVRELAPHVLKVDEGSAIEK